MLLCLCCVLGALAVVLLVGWTSTVLLARDRLLRQHLRDRLVVTLKSGVTFSGLLWMFDAKHLTLKDAKALAAGRWTPAEGEMFLPRAQIDYMQRPSDVPAGDAS